MNNRKKAGYLTMLIIFLPFMSVFGQKEGYRSLENAEAVRQRIQNTSRNILTLQASFTQLKHLSILENDIKSTGMFYFKQKNNLRWEYERPFQYIIVMSGNEIRIKNEGKVRLYDIKSNKLFSEISRMMSILLRGEIFDNTSFSVKLTEGDKDYLATLSPAGEDLKQFLNIVYVYFDKKQLTVNQLRMVENSGDYTLITFQDKKINGEIPDSIFSLQ